MNKILVSNPAHIGDVILTTSVLPVLRHAFPGAEIGVIVGSWAKPVVEDHLYIDRIHYFDHPAHNRRKTRKARKRIGGRDWQRVFKELRQEKYDLVFEMYSLYSTNLGKLFLQAEIPSRVGFWFSPTRHYFNHQVFWCDLWSEVGHLVEIHGALLRGFGIEDLTHLKPQLCYKNVIRAPSLPAEYIVIHVGVGERKREWNKKAWNELAIQLDSLGYPLLFVGHGSREEKLIEEITHGLKNSMNLCDKFSWRELLPIIKEAKILVGLESMAGHIAAVFDTPAVLLYGGTAKIERWRPYSPSCHVVSPHPSLFEGEYAPWQAIHSITAEDVFKKVIELISCQKERELVMM